ncbi:hypothetical protein AHMF7605_27010 [Adhaeribacter arboris]|uniref:Deacetylase PdaC domain-containing protein n=1 Tax=Adhaeribacter arboris TaxID=2072846 RepID=A0A2T2YN05_9BACT|nr:DUF4163 domain-containing protein [Adhaeribacter arboris]PSR56887.1 hypothetical protein AHMF7605_27010 [Adhaeribacter arboris]
MKLLYQFIFLLMLYGCSQPHQEKRDVSNDKKSAVGFSGLTEFAVDSSSTFDKNRNTQISIEIPVSGIQELDEQIKAEIDKQKVEFIKSIDELIKEDRDILTTVNSDFSVDLISAYNDKNLISYCFIISYYHGGAAHPMTMYNSFNFDKKEKKLISFTDYFNVKTQNDSIWFLTIINKAIDIDNVKATSLNEIDFNIEKDTISFNFDDYEIASYAEGIIQGRIKKSVLSEKIKNNYR